MNYRKKLVVEPGAKVHLDELDPSFTGKHESESDAKAEIAHDLDRLRRLQYRLYAEH